jgi:MAF protein
MKTLVLASTSPYRRELLEKLNLPFQCATPNIDETPKEGETSLQLVERLAVEKAIKVSSAFEDALIIGSDQVALCNGEILGKPHHFDNAVKQLQKFSNNVVTFYTGLCVYNTETKQVLSLVEPFYVHFKTLSLEDISYYLQTEKPYNCAGSFKSEGLGICLFEKLSGDDPNSLIGLPLIKLVELLKKQGLNVLAEQKNIS